APPNEYPAGGSVRGRNDRSGTAGVGTRKSVHHRTTAAVDPKHVAARTTARAATGRRALPDRAAGWGARRPRAAGRSGPRGDAERTAPGSIAALTAGPHSV